MSDPYAPEGRGRPADAPTHDFGSAGWDTASDAMDPVDVAATSRTTSADSGASTYGSGSGTGGTADAAKEQGQQLASETAESGKHVANVAKDEVKSVAGEAGTQARNLLGTAQSQLASQASDQKNTLVEWLRSLADELGSMADTSRQGAEDESSSTNGVAAQFAQRAQGYAHNSASWLDDHEPSQIFNEVGRFARRRPGVFLAVAAAAGVVAGRLTRGLTASSEDEGPSYNPTTSYDRGVSASDLSTTGYAGTGGYAGGTGYAEGTGYASGAGDVGYSSETAYTSDTGYASDDSISSSTYPTTGGVSSGPYGEEGR
jgi:ElaB/YqjD/DUF883 family membrane-anchored ribosome-binding protein